MSEIDPYFVPTRSSKINSLHSHELVIQESQAKKGADIPKINKFRKSSSSTSEEIDMKKVRFEVYKFAQSALSSTEKQKSNIELAIKLGAKAPKKKYKNYKQLKEDKIKEIEEAKRRYELYNTPIQTRIAEYKSKLNKGALRRKRKIGSGILNVYGTVKKKDLKNKK